MKFKTLLLLFSVHKIIKEYFRIMRISLFMLFVCVFPLLAVETEAQNTFIKIGTDRPTIRDIISEIENQTEYLVLFRNRDVDTDRQVSLQDKTVKITSLLDIAFGNTDISYEIENKYILLAKTGSQNRSASIAGITGQDRKTISGVVIDERGDPVIGANISEKGTTNGTITDMDGKFTLAVAERAILLVSYIGYNTQEIAVDNRTALTLRLTEDSQSLDEVVVVGYGTQRARDVTTSVANISMKNVKEMPVTGLDQALSGQVAGVMINSSNGIPGGGPQIQIRGLGAVGADSQPLYVVDGFALPSTSSQKSNPINDIPPQDIASITILKDASATAIYGSRGANGVILVTTRRGQTGAPRVQVSAFTGLQQVIPQEKPNMMNAQEFAQFQKERFEDNGLEVPELYRNPEALGKGTDWFDELTRIAPVNEINLSVSGGNEKIMSYVSAGYTNQSGVVINTDYQRFSARANVDANLLKGLNLGLSLAPTFTKKTRDMMGGDGRSTELGWAAAANPIPPVYKPDGSYNEMIDDGAGVAWRYQNPVQSMKEIDQNTEAQRLIATLFAEYEFIRGLKFKTAFNADWSGSNYRSFRPSTIGETNQSPPTIPWSRYYQQSYLNWSSENTFTYDKQIGNHSFTALLGFTYQTQTNQSGDFTGNDYTSDEVHTMNAASRIGTWGTSIEDWSLISYLARATYNYKQKYLLTATIRRDGSSRFGEDNRWGMFPSGSIGWRLSEEYFLKDVKWLSDLKLRASYGLAGNFQIGNYTYMSQITKSNYVFHNSLAGGRQMEKVGNPNLGWERVYEWNAGIDFGILNDRVLLLVDFYKRNTKDLLLDVELPASSGYTTAKENNGNLQNTGLEISVNSRNIRTSDFMWTTNANIAFNKNKVISLGRDNAPILTGFSGEQNPTHITMVGKPLGLFYGYVVEGLYTQAEIDDPNVPKFPGAIAGNLKVKDVDGSGDITAVNDFDIIGDPYPDFTFGITNTLIYKNLDLRIQMTGAVGGQLLKTQYEYTHNTDGIFNVTKDMANRYRSESQPGNGRIPTASGTSRGRVMYRDVNSDWVIDNDYLWVKNITLGYTFSNGIGRILSNARVYFSIQNAFLITGYDGNPEVTNYGTSGSKSGTMVPGVDYTAYPVPRTYSLGVNLTF